MNKKNSIIITSTIIILGLITSGSLYFIGKGNKQKERNNSITLAQSYTDDGEYNKALELLNELLEKNIDDEEIINLISILTTQKDEFEKKEIERALLTEELINQSESIFRDNFLDEFLLLKDELLKIDPENSLVNTILKGIDYKEEDLINKVNILMNSMFNAKTEKEATALNKMIYNLLDEAKIDFSRSQVQDAEKLKDAILSLDSENSLALEMEEKLIKILKEQETKEERAAFNKKIDKLLEQTKELLKNNQFQKAESLRQEIIDLDPENIEALALEEEITNKEEEQTLKNKIDSLLKNSSRSLSDQKFESAMDYIQEVLKLDPTNRDALKLKEKIEKGEEQLFNNKLDEIIVKTNLAIDKGQLDFAESLRQELLKLDPKNPQSKILKDKIAQKKKELASQKEQNKKDEIETLLSNAKSNYNQNKLLESEELYNRVLLLDENSIEALKGLADISIQNSENNPGEIPRSISRVLRVLDVEPNNIEYLVVLSELYERNKDYVKELDILKKIVKIDPSAKFYVKAGISSYKITRFEDAETYFYMAMDLDSEYPEIYYPLALTYEKLENSEQRGNMLKKGMELRPNHAATIYELGRFYTDEGRYKESLDLFLKANDIKVNSVKYQMGVALAYFNLGQFEKSIEIYDVILGLDQTISEVYYNLSLARMELGQYTQALTDISLAIKLKPNSPKYIYSIGQISEALGRDDNATTYYLTAVQLDNNYYKPMLNLGNIYDKYGRYEDGLKILKLAYIINPEDQGVRFSLGTSYLHNKLYEESLELLEDVYKNDKTSPQKLYTLSLAYTEVGENEKAENGFKRVLELDSEYWDAYFYLGQLLFSLDRQDEAKTYLKQVLELNPEYKYKDKILEVI